MEQKKLNELTYGFVGLGLMGGSMAKAIRKYILSDANSSSDEANSQSKGKIFALDKKDTSLKNAIFTGVIDKGFSPEKSCEMLKSCDFVFICLPPNATIQFLTENQSEFKKGAIVTEISGVKTGIFEKFPSGIDGINFIPSHPMAGNEREGFDFSSGDIFAGRNYIFLPYEKSECNLNDGHDTDERSADGHDTDERSADGHDTDDYSIALEMFKDVIRAIGFTNLITTNWKIHDHKIAFTSQLCHVIASALVDCAEDTQVTQFGGGSFEDLTRIALINAPLWTELFTSNKEELVSHIENFEKSLDKLKTQIRDEKIDELEKTLSNVRNRRAEMIIKGKK